eukprot:4296899-Amphidinium_carterae.1
MSPSRTSEQPDYAAVRGQSLSPRAGREQPYLTRARAPQSLSVEGPPPRGTQAQTDVPMHGEQSNDPMSDM